MNVKEEKSGKTKDVSNSQRNDVLLEWEAPSRLYKKRGKEYFSMVAAIVFLLSVILVVLREFLLIILVFAFAFFGYVLVTVEPLKVKNQLTKKGIRVFKKFFRWEDLTDYWVEFKYGYAVIHIRMPRRFPGRVILLVEKNKAGEVMEVLSDKLVYHELPQKNWIDRASDWMSKKIRFESSEPAHK